MSNGELALDHFLHSTNEDPIQPPVPRLRLESRVLIKPVMKFRLSTTQGEGVLAIMIIPPLSQWMIMVMTHPVILCPVPTDGNLKVTENIFRRKVILVQVLRYGLDQVGQRNWDRALLRFITSYESQAQKIQARMCFSVSFSSGLLTIHMYTVSETPQKAAICIRESP